jgi:hypothetical protein
LYPRLKCLGFTAQFRLARCNRSTGIVIIQPCDGDSRYNELMNCQVKDELVSQLITLNNKLNLLSPDLVHGDKERADVQEQRESLYAEIKHHRAKGHEGKPCPAARQVWASRTD